jgi:tetratricopeptide (TPR) repeat protein
MSGTPSLALQQYLQAVGTALRQNDLQRAFQLSEQAVSQGFEEPNLLTLAGQWRIRNGQLDRAYPVLLRACELAPNNIEALNAFGICLGLIGRPQDAIAVFDDALVKSPNATYLKLHRSQPLEDIGRLQEAQSALEQVLAAEPQNTQALDRLANLCARRGEMDAARTYASRALKLGPSPAATIALAMAELADKKYGVAHGLVAPLTADVNAGPVNRSIAFGIAGDALDGLDRTADAFAAYTAAREILRQSLGSAFQTEESAIARVRRLAGYFRSAPTGAWRLPPAKAAPVPVGTHVFLVGFPRSGTTLLEQAMASHGDIRTMEEVDCLGNTAGEFFYAKGGMERFAALDNGSLAQLRDRYWQGVVAAGVKTDRPVFVDKMPLNSVHQGLIARLFPSAKILFALRDPRDVVLSCFRRRLVMSAHMYELSQLDGAAAFYGAVMDLSAVYRELLVLPRLDVRHEDMIADFDGEMRRICDFLGIGWDDSMRDFATHARGRDIKTPSAQQVVRGLNREGAGQWRRFQVQLAPILPILAPWVERFGYKDVR